MGKYRQFITSLMRAIIVLFMFAGCTSNKYIPIESVKHDSIYITNVRRDSVHVHDSIFFSLTSKEDTVYKTRYVQRVVYRDALRTDTMFIERIDTVRIPYPVERELSAWNRGKISFANNLMITLFVVIVTLIWLIKRKI